MENNERPLRDRIVELEDTIATLENKLNYDALTGAFSRQYLYDQVADMQTVGCILIFVDLDDFKSVNDHHGHNVGDQLLVLIAQAMKAAVGPNGFVVRLAGDEFVILLKNLSEHVFERLERDIRKKIEAVSVDVGILKISRSASLGCIRLDTEMDLQEAIDLADSALMKAKADGKNRSQVWRKSSTLFSPKLPSIDAVRAALQRDEIGYHVQPIFGCSNLKVEGYEALLRWSLPSGEVLGPNQFLDTMTKAYDTVTRPPLAAARRTSHWAAFEKSKYISFNISEAFITRIVNEGLGWVDEVVGDAPADQIVFELLETVIDRQSDNIAAAVCAMRRRGIRVALDDFGTGHSSLERLQGLDVDYVKIDKRFVHGATQNQRGLDLFTGMIALSHRLGAKTVIEGIETQEHLNLAQDAQADSVQGYFLGSPKPIEDTV